MMNRMEALDLALVDQGAVQVVPGHFPIDKLGQHKCVNNSDSCTFRSGAYTAHRAAQNDDGHQKGQKGVQRDGDGFPCIGDAYIHLLVFSAPGNDDTENGQQQFCQNARNESSQEHVADGAAGILGIDHPMHTLGGITSPSVPEGS
ncbi:MAG: hypothetical protein V8R55_06815 [Dysosmobacter sp.]